jgi:hypothetical protein
MRTLLALMALLVAAPPLRAAVDVRVSPDNRVDVQATNAPLSEILDGLARQLKVKIVYEGPPPRQLLTVDLKGRTPAEAFLAIVEGQGLAYAVAMDKSGTKVESVLMAGGNNAPAANAGPPRASPRAERPIRESVVPDEPQEEPAADVEDEEAPPDGRAVVPHGKPADPGPPTQGVYIPTPGADFPSSTFAPHPPPPETNKPAPKPESTPPPFNP